MLSSQDKTVPIKKAAIAPESHIAIGAEIPMSLAGIAIV